VWPPFVLVVLAGYYGVPVLSELPWVQTHLAAPVAMLQEAYASRGSCWRCCSATTDLHVHAVGSRTT